MTNVGMQAIEQAIEQAQEQAIERQLAPEIWSVAFHEAGHAVVADAYNFLIGDIAIIIKNGTIEGEFRAPYPFHLKVFCPSYKQVNGISRKMTDEDVNQYARKHYDKAIAAMLVAGHMVDDIISPIVFDHFPDHSEAIDNHPFLGWTIDAEHLFKIAESNSKSTKGAARYVFRAKSNATTILQKRWKAVMWVAYALLAKAGNDAGEYVLEATEIGRLIDRAFPKKRSAQQRLLQSGLLSERMIRR